MNQAGSNPAAEIDGKRAAGHLCERYKKPSCCGWPWAISATLGACRQVIRHRSM
nr:MAG TPA: hypothetical protein [Caudoviricetes sp.]